jgi:hypothetical protein
MSEAQISISGNCVNSVRTTAVREAIEIYSIYEADSIEKIFMTNFQCNHWKSRAL